MSNGVLREGKVKDSADCACVYVCVALFANCHFSLQLQTAFTASSSASSSTSGGQPQHQVHYQFSPKCIMKLLDSLVYYPPSDFNEVSRRNGIVP